MGSIDTFTTILRTIQTSSRDNNGENHQNLEIEAELYG